MEEPVRFHVPAQVPQQTAEQKTGEAAISIEMTHEVGDDVEGSPKKKRHFEKETHHHHHHQPSTSHHHHTPRHTPRDTHETFHEKHDKFDKYDKYAFHTNTALRRGEVPSVSTGPWNTPLHQIQTGSLPSTRSTWLPYCLQWPMFGYPFQINEVNARIVGIQITALCAMVIAERRYRWSYYVTVLMFVDYTMRFLFGARASILGVTAEMIAYFLPRRFVPGPPKQFAALCGMLFTGLASILFFRLDFQKDDNHAENLGPAIVMGVLMGCAALEGFLNFCVGCLCFKIALKLGIFPQHAVTRPELVYDETESTSQEMDYQIDHDNKPLLNIWVPEGEHKVPLLYKSSTDAQKRAKFNIIKHMSGSYFMIPMGIAGLAIVWEMSSENHYENFAIQGKSVHHPSLPTLVWKILAIVAGIIWSLMILLWTTKTLFYPHKMYREWDHPQKRHMLCAAPITMLLFVYLINAQQQYDKLAEVLFWIAGPIQLTLSTLIMVYWIRELHHADSFTPVWMFGPLGNIVAAIVLPTVSNGQYVEAAWLWFSMGVFFWIILTTQSMSRLTWKAPLSDELRSSVFMLMAAPCVIMIAWISLNGGGLDGIARLTYFIGVGFSFVLTFLILTSYFGRNKFDINWWGYAFPLDTIAIASILYNYYIPNELTESICTTYIAIATWMHALLTCHFVLGLVTRNNGIFLSEPKDSPLAFMRMFHYAIRFSINHLNQLSHQFTHEERVTEFCEEFIKFRVALENHMKHEENHYFPAWRSQWPGMSEMFDSEHDHDAQLVSHMHQLVDRIMTTPANDVNRPALLEQITRQFESISKATIDHIEHEEKHLQWFNGKYLPLHAQYRLARQMWESTSSKDWAVITPWIIKNQYVHQRRVKFLAALRWAMPDVIQQVGHWLYEGVDELTFERLLVDIPELAPRHTWGYYRVW